MDLAFKIYYAFIFLSCVVLGVMAFLISHGKLSPKYIKHGNWLANTLGVNGFFMAAWVFYHIVF